MFFRSFDDQLQVDRDVVAERADGDEVGNDVALAVGRTAAVPAAAYLGEDDTLAEALAEFARTYADVNERDHAAFAAAVDRGELTAGPPSDA